METVVVVLMILVCFNFMMKQTFRKRGSVAAIAVVATLFVGLMWPYAIQQSKTQIADWLANVQLMLDTSVVLTVEVALQMAFCMLAVHVLTTGPVKKRTLWAYRALRWFLSESKHPSFQTLRSLAPLQLQWRCLRLYDVRLSPRW